MKKFSSQTQKKLDLKSKIEEFFDDNYFDVQGITPGISSLDEAYLARILTKLAIGSATVWWSLLEIKDFINLRNINKRRAGFYDLSRKDPF